MVHDPANVAAHASHSDTRLRRLLGGMSIFTMLVTIPQVLAIWVGHQAGGVSILSWGAYLASAVLWFWFGGLDCSGRCSDSGSHRLRIGPATVSDYWESQSVAL